MRVGVPKSWSLRTRLVAFFLTALLPTSLLIFYTAWQNQQAVAHSVNEGALHLARLAAGREQSLIEGAQQLLGILAQLPAVRTVDRPVCTQIVAKLIRESPAYANIGATQGHGGPFCSALSLPGAASAQEFPSLSRQAIETNASVISGYMLGRVSHKPVIAIASPWRDDTGTVGGVVFLGINLTWLQRLAAEVALPEDSAFLIVDANGIALARHPDVTGGIAGRSLKAAPLVREMLSRQAEGTIELPGLPDLRPDVPAIPRLWAFAPLIHGGTISGYVAVGIPRDVAFAPLRRTLVQTTLGFSLIGVLTLVALWAGGDRLIVRPLRTISIAAARLAAGDRNARVGASSRSDELGQLARDFDQMAAALELRERELGEAERRATAARFAAVLDAAADGIVSVDDSSFRIIQFNKGAEQMFGYSAAEVLGQPLDMLLPADVIGIHRDHVHAFAAASEQTRRASGRGELSGRRKGGEEFPIEVTISKSTVDGGLTLTAFMRDVTERRLLQNALRALAENASFNTDDTLFRVLVEHLARALGVEFALIGELTGDRAGRVATRAVYADGGIAPNFEYDLEGTPSQTVMNQTAVCFYEHGASAHFPADAWLAVRGIESYAGIALFGIGDRPVGVLAVMSRTMLNAGVLAETTLRVFAVRAAGEIERQRAAKALQRSEESARTLVENAPLGIFRSREDGTLLAVNPALVEMLGYDSGEDLLTRNLAADVYRDPDDRALVVEMRRAGNVGEADVEWKRKDGTVIVVRLRGRPLGREPATQEEFAVFVENVTEQRETERQLQQAQKLEGIGQLAAGVAHDFNNLLTVILGRTHLVRSQVDDRVRRDIDLIHRTAERAAALTRQLLAFSRRQILEPKVVDLNGAISGMITMLTRLVGESIELVFRPASELGRVKADVGQLEQVIANLAVNARDAMPEVGRLTVETANIDLDQHDVRQHVDVQPGSYVMFAVSDTGVGMDAATRARIFEPFFTTKEVGKGTGLGLSTVYGIVKQSGGHVWVYSEPGRGTTFKIYLPRVREVVSDREAVLPGPGCGTETILLVEDEDEVRTLARETLEHFGYTVLSASRPAEAMRMTEQHFGPIDMMVTDVVMPQMSGRRLAEVVAPLRAGIKVLYMSGYTDTAIVDRGILRPGTLFLPKPFTPDTLARKVREVLDAPKGAQP
jgi:PAS domain S-box-containing protein